MSDLDKIRKAIDNYARGDIRLEEFLKLMRSAEQETALRVPTARREVSPEIRASAAANRIRRL
jgi:hypothetical protein